MQNISRATAADIPVLLHLVNSAYRGEPSRKGWTTEADLLKGDVRTDEQELSRLMALETAVFLKYVADDGRLSGCVFLDLRAGKLYLGMLTVDPERQAQGIGKQLLAAAVDHARELGCPVIYLGVLSQRTELLAWYRRHGYEDTGARKPYEYPPKYGVPTTALEFVMMERKV